MLLVVLVIASVVGSQRLPLASSLCALTGRANCGLSSDQEAILFDIRLPRILSPELWVFVWRRRARVIKLLLRNPLAELIYSVYPMVLRWEP